MSFSREIPLGSWFLNQQTEEQEKRKLMDTSIARWKTAESELLADQTPIGILRETLFDQIGRDSNVQTAFNNHGWRPGAMEMLILRQINEGLIIWTNSLTPEQREAIGIKSQEPDSLAK